MAQMMLLAIGYVLKYHIQLPLKDLAYIVLYIPVVAHVIEV